MTWVEKGKLGAIPPGGDSGQVLAKASPVDKDVHWITVSEEGGLYGGIIDGGNAFTNYSGAPSFDFGSAY